MFYAWVIHHLQIDINALVFSYMAFISPANRYKRTYIHHPSNGTACIRVTSSKVFSCWSLWLYSPISRNTSWNVLYSLPSHVLALEKSYNGLFSTFKRHAKRSMLLGDRNLIIATKNLSNCTVGVWRNKMKMLYPVVISFSVVEKTLEASLAV